MIVYLVGELCAAAAIIIPSCMHYANKIHQRMMEAEAPLPEPAPAPPPPNHRVELLKILLHERDQLESWISAGTSMAERPQMHARLKEITYELGRIANIAIAKESPVPFKAYKDHCGPGPG